VSDEYLATYLNDHLGGSTAGLELAKRARDNNRATEFAETLDRIAREIEEERETLKAMIEAVGSDENPVKQVVAWVGEKVARLKPNRAFSSYSPLSRLIEFEGLMLGVSGKLALWRALAAADPPQLRGFELRELIERAERQRDELERFRVRVAVQVVGDSGAPARP
jgi:hypothetical protein